MVNKSQGEREVCLGSDENQKEMAQLSSPTSSFPIPLSACAPATRINRLGFPQVHD